MSLRMLRQRATGGALIRFAVEGVRFLERPDGTPYIQMDVADFSDVATLRWWCDWRQPSVQYPSGDDAFQAVITHRCLDGRLWLDSDEVARISDDELYRGGPLFLSRTHVPEGAYPALEKLVAIFNGIKTASIREFVGRVLTDQHIARRFVRCRASANHHHHERGGLLMHSVGVAERCLSCSSGLERSLHEVVIAAALLHDIGKLETVGEGPKRPPLAPWVHHEALTLEILASHLHWLDGEWPHGAVLLRHCLTWYSTKPAGFAGFVGADLIRAMDGIDVGIGMGKGSGEARFEPFRNPLRRL